MNEFPQEKEKFHELKDKLSLYKIQQVVGLKCYSCDSVDHLVKKCPKVHVVIPKTAFIESYIDHRNKFMTNYIRLGARSNRIIHSYSHLSDAAKDIQIKIFEGELTLDKTLNHMYSNNSPESPDISEHPPSIAFKRHISRIMGESPRLGEVRLTRKSVSVGPNKRDHNSIDIEVHVAETALPDIINITRSQKKKKSVSTVLTSKKSYVPQKPILRKQKNHTLYDDIDRIHNFTYYFPYHNFEIQYPTTTIRRKKDYFDYFSHSSTTKATLKRFVAILREKVRARKEAERDKDKDESPLRGSLLTRFTKLSTPTRSKFYKGKSMFGGGSADSPRNSDRSKGDDESRSPDRDDSRFEDNLN